MSVIEQTTDPWVGREGEASGTVGDPPADAERDDVVTVVFRILGVDEDLLVEGYQEFAAEQEAIAEETLSASREVLPSE